MPSRASSTITLIERLKGTEVMGIKFGSIVMLLLVFFVVKISFESAMAEKNPDRIQDNERSPASIDKSYIDHLNKK